MKIKDLTGLRFNNLIALRDSGDRKRGKVIWLCKCDCGSKCNVPLDHLQSGHTKSCGCLKTFNKKQLSHGHTVKGNRTKEYICWSNAVQRCSNPSVHNYHYYGGRGIKFNFISFEDFYDELGDAPSKFHSIDRIDVNGNYERGNIRWATPKEQQENRRI